MPVHIILLAEGRKPATEHLAPVISNQADYQVVTVHTRRDAMAQVQALSPAIIVLDRPSLRFDSVRFCDTLREMALDIPVLILLAEGDEPDPNAGTRAYLHYPFSAKKLLNRIARLLPATDADVLHVGDVTLNIKQRCVICGDRETHLTPRQAALLEVFMRHPGEILTRSYLMKHVWDTDYVGDTRTLDVHIHWVRKALEEDEKSPVYLHTIRHKGYRFEPPKEEK